MTLVLLADPLPFWQGMAVLAVALVVIFILLAIGGFFVFRRLFRFHQSKTDAWREIARRFGLSEDNKSSGIIKPLKGQYRDVSVILTMFGVVVPGSSAFEAGGTEVNDHIACEALFPIELEESFEIKTGKWMAKYPGSILAISSDVKIGSELFEKAYNIKARDSAWLSSILKMEMPDGKNPSLLDDLMDINNRLDSHVTVNNRSVKISGKWEMAQLDRTESIIEDAVSMVERFQAATHAIGH